MYWVKLTVPSSWTLALFHFNSPLCPLYVSICHTVVSSFLYLILTLHKYGMSSPSVAFICPLYTIVSFINDLSLSGKRHSFLFERISKCYCCSQEKEKKSDSRSRPGMAKFSGSDGQMVKSSK